MRMEQAGDEGSRALQGGALFEAHLAVRDVNRSLAFYRDVVGLDPALEIPDRGAAFLWAGGRGHTMLGLWSLGSAPLGLSLHVAFAATLEAVLAAPERLRALGVTPRAFAGEETDEPSVIGWMPAAAVYFEDPDGHMLELLAMLDDAARPEAGIVGWGEWTAAADDGRSLRIRAHDGDRDALRPLFALAEDSPRRVEAQLHAGEVLVGELGDRVVGHVQLTDAGPGALEIASLAVIEGERRRGHGRALVQAALARARRRGVATVRVATAAADIDNLRFYQRSGFRMRSVERDAFMPADGYPPGIAADGIPIRDRVWLDLAIGDA
jgi:lactoylglutathione lyase